MPRLVALLLLSCLAETTSRQPLDAGTWHFVPGRSSERLVAAAVDMPTVGGVPVTLPHRVQLPDTALWYERALMLPEDAALARRRR